MNIPSLKKLARDNGLTRVEIGVQMAASSTDYDYYVATVWGEGIGEHGCCFGSGENINAAIASVLTVAAAKRAPRVELAA